MTQKEVNLCMYLQNEHRGIDHAVHSQEIEGEFLIGDRDVRRIVRRLRQNGFPICSGDRGYYYAINESEIHRAATRLNKLSCAIDEAKSDLLMTAVRFDLSRKTC